MADRIVAAAALKPDDEVVEIGPGLGILSERIAACPVRRLCLVELDPRLAAALRERFHCAADVEVVESDFLKLDLPARVMAGSRHRRGDARPTKIKVIGNLPFNVAGAILRKLCESRHLISRMVLMFQREVGERIRAHPGTEGYSALSVYSALYWEIEAHFRVAAGNFHPRPKVDAEVIVFAPRPAPFEPEEEGALLKVIRAAFSSRRKTVRNALKGALKVSPAEVERALSDASIDPACRAETLAVADFVRLARALRAILASYLARAD